MDATVGFININQNKQDHQDLRWPAWRCCRQRWHHGMNFKFMPELDW
jgi:hypothetical protein